MKSKKPCFNTELLKELQQVAEKYGCEIFVDYENLTLKLKNKGG